MKLNDNEIKWIVDNTKLPQEIRNKILLEREKDEITELINKEQSAFNMSDIKEIVQLILNNEDAIRDISEYAHGKYPNEYLCVTCDKWKNGCKLKKNHYDKCNKIYESTIIKERA
ncbi:hypothetical protein EXM63_02290 [Clostridium botulinum]|uniref:Uncharacterized protein n=2 Tax=Clostridium TaxID=1485 RepID=A0A6M0SX14_CLOBO|nr:hypothetical protein [Clostridium sporogenes]NFA60046.1 hypothetical protein [Clostridium botulinum]APH16232.1 hypothetical protein NPD5_3403 [Clostridium sporogenes]NFI74378.1 hypothetical protein [Clostridium sporogenes]NFP62286.1 hypothetical protein [Clostridium sporogenes]NFU95562.1 hypothetical protein [Clostridium sporogenes]